MRTNFEETIESSISLKKKLFFLKNEINRIVIEVYNCLNKGNKVLICGNGGSAADAQHLAAEFLIRLNPKINRRPFPVLNLAQDTSTITACGNDYDFEHLFSRNLRGIYKKNDVLVAISTSGNSKNIINVLKVAKDLKVSSIGFLGNKGGKAKKFCNIPLIVDSDNVARIQEAHIFLGHYILESVENLLFFNKTKKKNF